MRSRVSSRLSVRENAPHLQPRLLGGLLVLFIAVFCCAREVRAQELPTPRVRDAAALDIVQKAIVALGGQAAVEVQGVELRGITATGQGEHASMGKFVWRDQLKPSVEFRHEFTDGTTTKVFVSGHGTPQERRNKKKARIFEHVAVPFLPYYLPGAVLYRCINNGDCSIEMKDPVPVAGAVFVHVQVSNDSDPIQHLLSTQDWYFDSTSGLPRRVEYRVPHVIDSTKYLVCLAEFSDFRPANGILLPFRIVLSRDGAFESVLQIDAATVNPALDPSDFDDPEGAHL